jgi:undecaprenyl-diphosphatase
MDIFFKAITWIGSLFVLLPITVLLGIVLYRFNRAADALTVTLGLVGCSLVTHLLKLLFGRPRPNPENLLVAMPPDFSFPSAHTSQITAFTFALWLVFFRGRDLLHGFTLFLPLLLLALLVGYSRVYLQVHYASDVFAGAVVGILWMIILTRLLGYLS